MYIHTYKCICVYSHKIQTGERRKRTAWLTDRRRRMWQSDRRKYIFFRWKKENEKKKNIKWLCRTHKVAFFFPWP
jgi:hypothetical protein